MGKAEIIKELEKLVQNHPENAQCEDVMYKIYVQQSIEHGLKASRAGRSLSHEEIKKKYQLSKWETPNLNRGYNKHLLLTGSR